MILAVPFLLSAVCLLAELTLTQVFNAVLFPGVSYFILGVGLAGIGIGGLLTSRWSPEGARGAGVTALAAALLPVLVVLFNRLEFVEAAPWRIVLSWLFVTGISLGFFSALGFVLTGVIRGGGARASFASLYSADLLGAGAGVALFHLLLGPLTPGRILLGCAAVLFALAGWRGRNLHGRRFQGLATALAVSMAAASLAAPAAQLDFRETFVKSAPADRTSARRLAERIEFSWWDLTGRIDVVDDPPVKTVLFDGGVIRSTIYPFDGDFAALRRGLNERIAREFWSPGVVAPYLLAGGPAARALVIGGGGGQEVKAALAFDTGSIDVAELVPALFELGRGRYARFNGGIFNHPSVRLHVSDGRSFLRERPGTTFDIIQIFSAHTTTGLAGGGGGFLPTPLMTVEAFREYFDHLAPRGVLQVTHPMLARIIVTAGFAWRGSGRGEFRRHVIVADKPGLPDILPVILIRKQPWEAAEVERLGRFFHDTGGLRIVENPLSPDASFLSGDFYHGEFPDSLRALDFDASPATDDHPYLKMVRKRFLTKPATLSGRFLTDGMRSWLGWEDNFGMPFGATIVLATLASLILVGLPFVGLLARARPAAAPVVGMRGLAFFTLQGLGFAILESGLISFCAPFLGNPQLALAAILSGLLSGSAAGAVLGARMSGAPARMRFAICAGTAVLLAGIVAVFQGGPLFGRLAAQGSVARAGTLAIACALVGVFAGAPFPMIARRSGMQSLPGAWFLNGYAAAFGAIAASTASLAWGNRTVLALAGALYLVSGVLSAVIPDGGRARS